LYYNKNDKIKDMGIVVKENMAKRFSVGERLKHGYLVNGPV